MSLEMIINIILTLLLPVMVGVAYWLFYFLIQRMPQQQRLALEQFATIAVQKVEQQNVVSPQKKIIATGIVADLFKAFKLPVPPLEVIDAAIESKVFDLKKSST